jgi:hypothetical protein
LLKQYSKAPLVRGSYFSLLKIYRKTRKKKLKDFRKNIIDELDNLKETIQVNIGKSSSEKICSSSNLLRSFLISGLGAFNLLLLSS